MSLFGKSPEKPQADPIIDGIRADIDSVKKDLAAENEEMQKQVAEVCSALNVLDGDIESLKAAKDRGSDSLRSEIKEMKASLDSLALIGRLCLQNKADIEVLTRKLEALEKKPEAPAKSPVKLLN